MSVRAVRWVVVAVCVCGIAGMIVASVNDNNGAALTFGLVTTVAVVCLVVATAVTRPAGATVAPGGAQPPEPAQPSERGQPSGDEVLAERIEGLVAGLVATGADETTVRSLVREAVRFGRSRHS